ncbi:MAG: restriction endonuclease subunit S [Clostridium neonatale]|uniref:restriction endonuclease subunit S n=1 Tax=Clostridium neonatale TaxID=137838 RepID=UPI00291BFE7A|nr:type I restriction enzyme, S subunit [Clostridium neonatale]
MTRKMKDSGVEWIGEIPEEWDTFRIAKIAEFINGYAFSSEELKEDEEVAVIRIGDIKEKGIDYISCLKYPNCESLNNFMIHDNDILIAMSGATAGKSSYITNVKKAYINQRVGIIRGGENSKFIYYCLNNNSFNSYVNLLAGGSAQPNISAKNILEYRIPKILLKEQKKIVSYLDEKCNKIDQTIEKEKQVIEKLKEYKQSVITEAVTKGLNPDVKMKDSGVEWIGEIPEHWTISRFCFETWVRARLGWKGLKADEYVDDGYIFLATPNIKNKDIDFENVNYINKFRYDESPEIKLSVGDVLLTKDGSTLGTVNVIRELPKEATVNSSIAVITPGNNICGIFLMYYIKGDYIQTIINNKKDGMGVPHLFQKDINKMNLICPPLNEQQQIADYLDKKCSAIDKLISSKEKLIDKLTEYKKSLIYECVTGKREVQ